MKGEVEAEVPKKVGNGAEQRPHGKGSLEGDPVLVAITAPPSSDKGKVVVKDSGKPTEKDKPINDGGKGKPDDKAVRGGKKYALLVGVREYVDSKLRDLKYTENDMEGVGKALKDGGFEVTLLTTTRGKKESTERPTVANIRQALRKLVAGRTRNDTVLFAFAGHGGKVNVEVGKSGKTSDENMLFPADARISPKPDSKTMVSVSELFRELELSGAGARFLLLDGNLDPDSVPRPPRGLAALFACRGGEKSFETDKLGKGHGVFFYNVIQALEGKAKNERGEVTWNNMSNYVFEQVPKDVTEHIGGGAKQTPHELRNLMGTPSPLRVYK